MCAPMRFFMRQPRFEAIYYFISDMAVCVCDVCARYDSTIMVYAHAMPWYVCLYDALRRSAWCVINVYYVYMGLSCALAEEHLEATGN